MLSTKTAQTLYEAAEIEFSTIVGGADVGREEIQDIRTQAETIKAFLCACVDGLAEMYCVFGCKFSGTNQPRRAFLRQIRQRQK